MNSQIPSSPNQADPPLEPIQIERLTAEIYPDQRRIKVDFYLSSYQVNPNARITLYHPDGEELTSSTLVNIFLPANEITLHIPAQRVNPGEYRIEMELYYVQEAGDPEDQETSLSFETIPLQTRSTTLTLP